MDGPEELLSVLDAYLSLVFKSLDGLSVTWILPFFFLLHKWRRFHLIYTVYKLRKSKDYLPENESFTHYWCKLFGLFVLSMPSCALYFCFYTYKLQDDKVLVWARTFCVHYLRIIHIKYFFQDSATFFYKVRRQALSLYSTQYYLSEAPRLPSVCLLFLSSILTWLR